MHRKKQNFWKLIRKLIWKLKRLKLIYLKRKKLKNWKFKRKILILRYKIRKNLLGKYNIGKIIRKYLIK